ncbi:MAG: hypothetical protein H6750_15845 [Nitrospiraceae bacterium]|nr:hypothetical protein [Nitrospiraceae bacterium]MCW5784638.1 hypothetical protein [Nitrospirales bacterium]
MNRFWLKNKYRVVGAAGLAVGYLFILGAWWVLTGAKGGERFGSLMFFLNLPIALPFFIYTPLRKLAGNYEFSFYLIYLLGGFLQYALIGWLLGPVLKRFDREGQKQIERSKLKNNFNTTDREGDD